MKNTYLKYLRVLLLAALLLALCFALGGCYDDYTVGNYEPGHVHTYEIGDHDGDRQIRCGVPVMYLYDDLPVSFTENVDPYNDNEIVGITDRAEHGVVCGQPYPEYEMYHCTECGTEIWRPDGKTQVIDHDMTEWDYVHSIDMDTSVATCTEPKKQQRHCYRCGYEEWRSVGKPLGHDYKQLDAVPATCTEPGNTAGKKCRRCGHFHSGQEIPALGHDWGEPSYTWSADKATCTATRVCKRDDEHVETETVDSTVTKNGLPCTSAYTAVYTAVFSNPDFQTQTASAPLAPEPHTPEPIPAVPATCVTAGLEGGTRCAVCQTVLEAPSPTEIDPNNHEGPFSLPRGAADVPSTCATHGYHSEGVCVACGVEVRTELPLDPNNHEDTLVLRAVPATCVSTGLTEGEQCSGCGKVFVAQEETPIDPNNHDWGAASYTWGDRDLTCTASRTCKRDASHVESQTVNTKDEFTGSFCTEAGKRITTAAFDAPFETQTKTRDYPAMGHLWRDWTIVTEPTCTEAGTETRACNRKGCDATETRNVAALGHDWGEWTQTVAPTCSAEGEETRACRRDGCEAQETRAVDKDENAHVVVDDPAVPATCVATGLTAGSHCSACDTVLVAQEVTEKDPNNHKPVEVEPGIDPTCQEPGFTALIKCEWCETTLQEPNELPTVDHSYGEDGKCIWCEKLKDEQEHLDAGD